jgi:intracellular sulfur oxidation DsrE/DsrF family protein
MNIKKYFLNLFSQQQLDKQPSNNIERRNFFYKMMAGSGVAVMGVFQSVQAHKLEVEGEKEERFPGDPPEHFIVFPLNHSDKQYHNHVLGSVGAMIAKYEDNIDQVVVCFGRGIHVLLKNPIRPVEKSVMDKIKSLAGQGVKFHACNRTLSSLELTKDDVLPFVKVIDVGAADIMELQEQNYALMVW